MSIVKASEVTKIYQVYEKEVGLKGSLRGLFKRNYKTVKAVNNISFSIDEGELVGFIGPNGAGKTTTLKMLSGLLYPTSGEVEVLNKDPWKREYSFLKNISLVMGQKNQLMWDLPAIESFRLAKDIYGIPDVKYKKTLSQLIDMLDLKDKVNIQTRKLSLGERMKAELVAALLHNPKVLFLDEPTIGLDVVMQKNIREFISDYNKNYDGAIILTSHYMADVKELCKRVIIIDKGEILYDGSLNEIIHKFSSTKTIEASFSKNITRIDLSNFKGFRSIKNGTALFDVKREEASNSAANILAHFPVSDINIKDPEIEDVIRDIFSSNGKK